MPPRHGGSPGATPGNRTKYSQAERQHAAESPKLSLLRAARRQPAIFRGRGRQVMHLPCKQVDMGALPIDSTISLRGTRLKHRGRSHKPFEAGVIPAPATNFREVIHLPDCKSGVVKQSWKRRAGALPALPTSLRPLGDGGEGCRVEAQSAKTDFTDLASGLRLGKPFLDS